MRQDPKIRPFSAALGPDFFPFPILDGAAPGVLSTVYFINCLSGDILLVPDDGLAGPFGFVSLPSIPSSSVAPTYPRK